MFQISLARLALGTRASLTATGMPLRCVAQVLGLLMALFLLEQNCESLAAALRIHPTAGTLVGANGKLASFDRGTFIVAKLEPSSPLARAGVKVDDRVTMDDALIGRPSPSIDVPVGLTVKHANGSDHIVVVPAPLKGNPDVITALLAIAYIVCNLLAAFLLVVGGRRIAALELGFALAAFATPSSYLHPLLAGAGEWRWPGGITIAFANVVSCVAFLAFALRIDVCANGRRNRISTAVAIVVAATTISAGLIDLTSYSTLLAGNPIDWPTRRLAADILPFLVTFGILIDAARRADTNTWRRHATLIVGVGLFVVSQLVTDIGIVLGSTTTFSTGVILQVVASILGAGLMTHGVFGQRVIDVGFVINRTLVYALTSLVLLVAFGLLEWAINFFAPVHGRGRSAAIGALLALTVSLTFHRVHRLAAAAVERLFFRPWHEREEELRAFLREAPFFKRQDSFLSAALNALRRFAEEAPIAIYQRSANGDFALMVGHVDGFNDVLNADTDFLVRLRAKAEPVQTGPASLVLPMTTRNELNGAIVLGQRTDGTGWRSDQIGALMKAARDIGQDLQVLEIDRLQAEVVDLSKQLATPSRPLLSAITRLRGKPDEPPAGHGRQAGVTG